MEIDHYPTPPPQNRQRTQNFQQNPQPEEDKPLFIPEEEDCTFPRYDYSTQHS